MKCTSCAADLTTEARFCPQCGCPTSAAEGEAAPAFLAATPQRAPISQIDTPSVERSVERSTGAAEEATTEAAISPLSNGKVLTSPFPSLPETSADLGIPGKKMSGTAVHAHLAQANLHRMRRQWEEAVDCCVAVLRAQPANQTAHVVLGDIYRDQNRLEDAIQWYRMAVDLRPNPTDEAKLEQIVQERDRLARQDVKRARQGYGNTEAAPIDRGTDLNTGTVNLMGVSPRRWLRGITVTSLAFAVLVLIGLIWTSWRQTRPLTLTKSSTEVRTNSSAFGLPPHHTDRTPPSYLARQAANGEKSIIVGGGGLPPDRDMPALNAGGHTAATSPENTASQRALPAARAVPGTVQGAIVPLAPVENIRPLPQSSQPSGMIASSSSSNRLTDGMQLTQIASDGGIGVTVMLTGAPSLVIDGGARGQEVVLRNVYRAARTALNGNSLLMRARVLVQTQVQGVGAAVVLEAEVDRKTAMTANPDSDDPMSLQNRLISYRWSGVPSGTAQENASPAPDPPSGGSN